jgi:hypothetical protein
MQSSHKEMPPFFMSLPFFKGNNQFITAGLEHCQSFLGMFAKLQKVTVSFVMCVHLSIRQRGTARLPLDGFS